LCIGVGLHMKWFEKVRTLRIGRISA